MSITQRRIFTFCLALLGLLLASRAQAQIIIIPPYPPPYPIPPIPHPPIWNPPPAFNHLEFAELALDAHANDQQAEVQLTQTLTNTGDTTIESELLFPLPEDAAIGNLTLLVDGKEITGKLLGKDEARATFEEIVRRQRDPALLEYAGRGLFRVSVFPIPAHSTRKLTLRYTQLLKRDGDTVAWLLPIGGGGGVSGTQRPGQLTLHVRLETSSDLKSIYSPSHDVEFERDGARRAKLEKTFTNPTDLKDFALYFSSASDPLAATILSYKPANAEKGDSDGYFLMLASPGLPKSDAATNQAKSVIFVLDRSGSMTGEKLTQAKAALTFVVKQLHEGDTFNIVVFDDRVETYKPELAAMNPTTRAEALKFVDDIRAGGSTNISEALATAFKFVNAPGRAADDPAYILFLTDGLPTAGDTQELTIAAKTQTANTHHARLLVWGVGDDVNARLLDRLSGQNGGASDYVRPGQDIEAPVSRTFTRISSPVLTHPELAFDGVKANRMYPQALPDFFAGSQLVLLGRYPAAGKGQVKLTGKVHGETKEFSYPAEFSGSADSKNEFIARLWATRRIGDLIDQIDMNGQNAELTNEIVALGTQFGILTPYTSFLAREDVSLDDTDSNRATTLNNLGALNNTAGSWGVDQRALKQQLNRANQAPSAAYHYEMYDKDSGARGGMGGGAGKSATSADHDMKRLRTKIGSANGAASTAAPAFSLGTTVETESDKPHPAVQNLAGRTLFWKNNRWEDSALSAEELKNAVKLKQFSAEWFALSRRLNTTDNQALALREAAVIRIEGKVYLIEPEAAAAPAAK